MTNEVFKKAAPAEVRHVMNHLRPQSAEEIELQGKAPHQLVPVLINADLSWSFYSKGEPVAIAGAIQSHPGNFGLFGFGTDRWDDAWRMVTLVLKRDMLPALHELKMRRAQAMSPQHHLKTHKWLRFLGAQEEVRMSAWGVGGEDFRMFVWFGEG